MPATGRITTRAYARIGDQEEWQFVIAGWDQGSHEAELKRLCKDLGLAYADVPASDFNDNRQLTTDNGSSVVFTGPAFGNAKDQLLRRASAFILPSFSEGLPMSVLEAWSEMGEIGKNGENGENGEIDD